MTVPTIPTDVQEFIDQVRKQIPLYETVLFAWMVCEDDAQLEKLNEDFNPLNIRYTYEDHKPWTSNQAYWKEATGIKQNGVVVYPSLEAGARATIACMLQAYYVDVRATVNKSPLDQAVAIQTSPWDAANYGKDTEPPGHIVSLLTHWGFVDKPVTAASTLETSNQEKIIQAAQAVHTGYSAMWEQAETNGKDFLHFHLQTLRAWLVANGMGEWEDNSQTTIKYQGVEQSYTI